MMCPVRQEIMTDPVVLSNGITYEREVAEKWLKDHDTSPLYHEALKSKEIYANIALRKGIAKYV